MDHPEAALALYLCVSLCIPHISTSIVCTSAASGNRCPAHLCTGTVSVCIPHTLSIYVRIYGVCMCVCVCVCARARGWLVGGEEGVCTTSVSMLMSVSVSMSTSSLYHRTRQCLLFGRRPAVTFSFHTCVCACVCDCVCVCVRARVCAFVAPSNVHKRRSHTQTPRVT